MNEIKQYYAAQHVPKKVSRLHDYWYVDTDVVTRLHHRQPAGADLHIPHHHHQ